MIQTVKTDGLSINDCKLRAQEIFNLFKTIIKEFKEKYPNIELSLSDNIPFVEVFFIGNKRVGTKYDMETWKQVPIYKCNLDRYAYYESDNNYFLRMGINYADGGQSSEDWKLDEIQLRMRFESALTNCIKDFTETKENIL